MDYRKVDLAADNIFMRNLLFFLNVVKVSWARACQ